MSKKSVVHLLDVKYRRFVAMLKTLLEIKAMGKREGPSGRVSLCLLLFASHRNNGRSLL